MQRFVALVIAGPTKWTVVFPDFPDIEVSGFLLHVALGRAQREIGERAAKLKSHGAEMAAPMGASGIVLEPRYKDAMPFIIAVPGQGQPEPKSENDTLVSFRDFRVSAERLDDGGPPSSLISLPYHRDRLPLRR